MGPQRMTPGPNPRVVAVMTCFNRREQTLACLDRLAAQSRGTIELVLVDDGSTDGTADAVRAAWPSATILQGSGELYWAGGMRLAMQHALEYYDLEHLLWLNDDTMLDTDAVDRLLATHRELRQAGLEGIVVGTTVDAGGTPTYGGMHRPRPGLRPLNHRLLLPAEVPRPAETLNGNIALIPVAVCRSVGVVDVAFRHGMADFDYGHRARAAGFKVTVAAGVLGTCARNPAAPPLGCRGLPAARAAWQRLVDPKGVPPAEWRTFARRWGGPFWWFHWSATYVKGLVLAFLFGWGPR
jgi:GT2 family glycosyltransferase